MVRGVFLFLPLLRTEIANRLEQARSSSSFLQIAREEYHLQSRQGKDDLYIFDTIMSIGDLP